MTFQDELIELVSSFSIESIDDFNRLPSEQKTYFVSRLYKCFSKGLQNMPKEIGALRGLKLHYERIRGAPDSIPGPQEKTYFKKLAFLASRSVVTCPIQEVSHELSLAPNKRTRGRERLGSAALQGLRSKGLYLFGDVKADRKSHGGELHVDGPVYVVDKNHLKDLIEIVVTNRAAIKGHMMYILPALPGREKEIKTNMRKAGVLRGNFRRRDLVKQFTESDLLENEHYVDAGLVNVYLPHLTNIPLEAIVDLRESESQGYTRFQHAIDEFLKCAPEGATEAKLQAMLERVDEEVRHMESDLRKAMKGQGIYNQSLLQLVAVGLIALVPSDLVKAMSFMSGTHTVFDALNKRREARDAQDGALGGDFFVAWKLAQLSR